MTVEGTDERSWHFKQLRRSLERLAASADDRNVLFPDLVMTADELALDFDHWAAFVCDAHGGELTAAQRAAMDALGQAFTRMSRDASEFDADVWSDAALKTSEHWASVRRLACAALDAFGWTADGAPVESTDSGTEFVW
jgi:hypothetical protein